MIQNPILRGFNADPSICRVGGRYYIATSTFEWYPGVQIHASDDLAQWALVARPLARAGLLDMRGNPDSCGIWAPCLSYADGRFWLVYTDVKRLEGDFKDAHNYITHAPDITGPWSDPIYVNSSGFDPSLFHDADGRKWFMNMRWNHGPKGSGRNPAHDRFDGIELQEWHPERGLIGPVHMIYAGTGLGLTEAPHIFARGGWYYLTVAEGGTGYDHAVTMARARAVTGPYETHPQQHLMTARFDPAHPLQRVGHGQYVEAPDGTPLHTFLCGRPVAGPAGRFCATGRETGLALCEWRDDGWLYLQGGGLAPPVMLNLPSAVQAPPAPVAHDFTALSALPPEFQWLRTPQPERLFHFTPQGLRLTGRESIGSWFEQALVARRQCESRYGAWASLTADPPNYQRAAGLVTYYNRHKFHAAWITRNAAGARVAQVVSCLGDWHNLALTHAAEVPLPDGPITLRVAVQGPAQQFYWGQGQVHGQGQADAPLGPVLDASIVSDEGGRGEHASFTGAFVGMFAMDLTGQGWGADFHRFFYADA
jgi:xylan 1,4-beta-xylosidase